MAGFGGNTGGSSYGGNTTGSANWDAIVGGAGAGAADSTQTADNPVVAQGGAAGAGTSKWDSIVSGKAPTSGGTNWDSVVSGGGGKAAAKKKDSGGVLGAITHGISVGAKGLANVAQGLGTGIAGLGVDTAELVGGKGWAWDNQAKTDPTTGQQESSDQQFERQFKFLGGIAKGMKQTGSEIAHPTQIARNYSKDPVGSFLNDLGNVSIVLPGVGSTIEALGQGGKALELAKAGDLARAGEVASQTGQATQAVGRGIRAVGELPSLPIKGAKGMLASAGEKAMAAAEAGDKTSALGRAAVRFTPAMETARDTVMEHQAQVKSIISDDMAAQKAGTVEAAEGKQLSQPAIDKLTQQSLKTRQSLIDSGVAKTGNVGLEGAGTGNMDLGRATSGGGQGGGGILKTGTQAIAKGDIDISKLLPQEAFNADGAIKPEYLMGKGLYINNLVGTKLQDMLAPKLAAEGAKTLPGAIADTANSAYLAARIGWAPQTLLNRAGHAALVFGGAEHPVNALWTAVKYGLNPDWLSEEQKAVVAEASPRLMKGGTQGLHSALVDRAKEMSDAGGAKGLAGKAVSAGTKAMDWGPFYKVAHVMDNATRMGTYLSESKYGATADEALKAVMRVTGEYDRSTAFQRNVMQRVIPFWTWHREVARMVGHLAEDHPVRAAFAAHMADIANKANGAQGLQPGQFKIGGQAISSSFANPFGEAGSIAKPQSFLGPWQKGAWVMGTGALPTTGKPPSAPSTAADARSGQIQGSGMHQLPAALNQIEGGIPQLNWLRQAGLLGGPGSRYGNGAPRTKLGGQPLPPPSVLTRGLSAGGIYSASLKDQNQTAANLAAAAAKQSGGGAKARVSSSKKKGGFGGG